MKKPTAVITLIVIIVLHSLVWVLLRDRLPNIEQENGIMENYQAICLVLCAGIWVAILFSSKLRAERVFFAGLALFTLSLLVLEVDFRAMKNAATLNKVMNGRIRDIWLGGLWLCAGIFFLKNRLPVIAKFMGWIRTSAGMLLLVSGLFWILATLVDKGFLGTKTLFREELLEVNAAALMVVAAFLTHLHETRLRLK